MKFPLRKNIGMILHERSINLENGLSRSTVHCWMLWSGCKYEESKQCYYTDFHNRPDVLAYRNKYIAERHRLALLQPLWYQMSNVDCHVDTLTDDLYDRFRKEGTEGGNKHSNFAAEAREKCKYCHASDVCKCHCLKWHVGQDESIYRSHSAPWMVN